MKKLILPALFIATASVMVQAGSETGWGYIGKGAPENWAKLSPDYSACSGLNQSPINLTGFIESELKPLGMDYQAGGQEVVNNGHTVQVNYAEGSTLKVDGKDFKLVQFHFHAPSENHINGESFPMEAHLVHANEEGKLAVVAVMFREGAENPTVSQAWSSMPAKAGEKAAADSMIDVQGLLPENRDYYRFNGSLTTPPCTEGVRWLVMKEAVTASSDQIKAFAKLMKHPNNRPVQTTNARPVLQ